MTTRDERSIGAYLKGLGDETRRHDAQRLDRIVTETGDSPAIWGESIAGYGALHRRYATGHEVGRL